MYYQVATNSRELTDVLSAVADEYATLTDEQDKASLIARIRTALEPD